MTLQLDRLCRRKALEAYAGLPQRSELALFLNFDASVVDQGVRRFRKSAGLCTDASWADSGHIVIEIIESKVKDLQSLQSFAIRPFTWLFDCFG